MTHRRRPALLLALLALLLPACAASPAAWKNLADRNIDRYRKRDAQLQLLSSSGQPLANIPLRITQTRQAFPFGAAISRSFLQNPRWQQEFLRHFNYAVFENEAKWYSNEPAPGRITYRDADALLAWCDAHHIPVRGHNLFWEVARWQQPWLAALDHDALAAAVQKRLDDALSHFRGRFTSWDVDNEALHGDFFTSRLGPGVIPWMFQAAHQRDPSAALFTNDFNILSIDQNFSAVQTQAYVAQIRALLKAGAPIDGIGVQGHLWQEDLLHHPERVRQRLDMLATLHLPIWITEFDVADPDPEVRADKLELVYRTAFSHPAVAGIVMWVFWAGDSWRGPDAALFNQDWSINPEGQRFESLLAEWSTHLTLSTDAAGRAHFRGFYGDYEVRRDDTGQLLGRFSLTQAPGAQLLRLTAP